MKKHLFFFTIAMFFSIATAFAQGGTTGPLTWNLKDGVLTISGEGEMPKYNSPYEPPWSQYGGITTVIIETGVANISDYAFWYHSSLTSVTIGNSVTRIENNVFYYCSALTSITMGNSVKTIGQSAFFACVSLTSITLPNSVTSIGDCAFSSCTALTSIIIPNGVTSIGTTAFGSCNALSSVTLPKSITNIDMWAFSSCALTAVTNLNPEPIIIDPKVFEFTSTYNCTLNVPNSAVLAYQEAAVWNEFKIVGSGFFVNVVSNNIEYGYSTGDGLYQINETAIITAIARNGYKFVNWTKKDEVISTDNPYNFTVTEDV
jgi:hypothetical protein